MRQEHFLHFGLAIIFLFLNCGGGVNYCNAANGNSSVKIVGGKPTTHKFIPYIVNLRVNGQFSCGGTLITRRIVVTAAHCVKGVKRRSITIVGGTSLLNETGVVRKVSKFFVPKAFTYRKLDMDVAVLKLGSPMYGSNIRPIKLCNSNWKPGDRVRVSGWGLTSEYGSIFPNRLQTVRVRLISKKKCLEEYQGRANLTDTMFCASVPGKKDSCSGDSGGPLVYGKRLCGIVSWGIGCARKKFPGVYTSIKKVRRFIKKAMRK